MKIEVTKAELRLLLTMASEVAEHEDIMKQTFVNGRKRQSAYDVYNRLWDLYRQSVSAGHTDE